MIATIRVPSASRMRSSTLRGVSPLYQSSLCPTSVRPPATTPNEVQCWAGGRSASPSRASSSLQVSSSPRFGTMSLLTGTPEPAAMPSSSSTICGSQRREHSR